MPRQIVPVTDVDAILLTQQEGDERYLPITYTPPPVDLSLYYTKVQSDGRYEPIDTMYTKLESDARYQPVGSYQPSGDYALTSHLHTGVYQPAGSYSLTTHNHDAAYLPLSHAPGTDPHTQYLNNARGDARYSLTAHLHTGVYQPAGSYAPAGAYLTQATADPLYVNVGGDTMSSNLLVQGAEGQPETVRLGSAYNSPGVYSSGRMFVLCEGAATYRAMGGTATLQGQTGVSIYAPGGDITVNPGSGVFVPAGDNAKACGWTTARWSTVHAANGSIQTCHATEKKNFVALDPAACVEAVLGTDWLSYEYIPPPVPAPTEGETIHDRMRVLDEYVAAQAKTLVFRKQNGYVLGHETHKTHDLFGLADRQSANASSDLGILACALQEALRRIHALESLQGVTA